MLPVLRQLPAAAAPTALAKGSASRKPGRTETTSRAGGGMALPTPFRMQLERSSVMSGRRRPLVLRHWPRVRERERCRWEWPWGSTASTGRCAGKRKRPPHCASGSRAGRQTVRAKPGFALTARCSRVRRPHRGRKATPLGGRRRPTGSPSSCACGRRSRPGSARQHATGYPARRCTHGRRFLRQ